MARRSHSYAEGFSADANFEWFLGGKVIIFAVKMAVVPFRDLGEIEHMRFSRHTKFSRQAPPILTRR